MVVSQIPSIRDGLPTWLCENGTAALSSFKGEAGKWEHQAFSTWLEPSRTAISTLTVRGSIATCTCSFVWIQPHLVSIECLYLYFLVSWEILA